MACQDLMIVQEDYQKRPNSEEKKQSIYAANTITDEILDNLFKDKKTSNKQFNELYTDEDAIIPYKSAKDKSNTLKYFDEDQMPFGEVVGEISDGRDVRDITIALTHLLSTAKSEDDLTRKYNLNEDEVKQVSSADGSRIQTSYSNMARTIGREILSTYGVRLVPKNAKGLEKAIAKEIEFGEQALQKLNDRNLLNIEESGSIVNRNFKKENPTGKDDTQYGRTKHGTPSIITGIKTVSLKPVVHEGPKLTKTQEQSNFRSMSKLAATRALINPSNRSAPYSEAQGINRQHQDLTMTDVDEAILEQVQSSPLAMTPYMQKALEQLRDKVITQKGTTKSNMAQLAEYLFGSKASPSVFGTLDNEALAEIMMTDTVGLEQQYGKSLAKVLQFNRIFDDWDNVQGNLFYDFQTANQNRAHVIQQTLSYQSDNFLSRHVLGSPEVQTLADNETKYLVAYIADETGLSIADIVGTSKDTSLLDEYIDSLNNEPDEALNVILELGKDLDAGKNPLKMTSKSAWEAMSYIQAIRDLREGIYSGKAVETRFMPKPDATASGALITVAQAARYGGAAAEVVSNLQNGKLPDGTPFTDMYQLTTSKLKENFDAFGKYAGKSADKKKKAIIYGKMKDLINRNYGIVANERALTKLPFTKYIYGQTDKNNAIEIAKELASLMIDTDNVTLMNKFVLDNETLPTTTPERRVYLIEKLSAPDGVATELVSIVDETTGKKLFAQQKDSLSEMHELLEEARYSKESSYNQIAIIPPLAWIKSETDLNDNINYETYREKFSTVIEKYFETVLDDGNGSLTTIKKRYPNVNNIRVLLQHMTDAAIMYESLGEMFNKPSFKDYFDGIMLNHDAIGGTTKFAMELEPVYKSQITEVNSKYDFIEATLAELKFARSRTTSKELADKMDTKISEIEAELPAQIKTKQEILAKNDIASSFGVKTDVLNEANDLDLTNLKQGPKKSTKKKEAKKEDSLYNIVTSGGLTVGTITDIAWKVGYPVGVTIDSIEAYGDHFIRVEATRQGRDKTYEEAINGLTPEAEKAVFGTSYNMLIDREGNIVEINKYKPSKKDQGTMFIPQQEVVYDETEIPFATASGFSFGEVANKVKKVSDAIISSAEVVAKELDKSTADKNRDHFKELFNFTEKETKHLEKRFGKDGLARITNAIMENAGDINTMPNFDAFQYGSHYNPQTGKVVVPSMLNLDPRLTTFTKSELLEMNSKPISSVMFLRDKAKMANSLKGFKQKVVYFEILAHELDHKTNYNSIVEFSSGRLAPNTSLFGIPTESYTHQNASPELQYIQNTILDLRKVFGDTLRENDLSPTLERIRYALYGQDIKSVDTGTVDAITMMEFTAIMRNEPKYAEELYKAAYPNKSESWITNTVKQLLKAIQDMVDKLSGNRNEITKANVNKLSTLFKGVKNAPSRATLKAALDIAHYKAMLTETKGKPTDAQQLGFINVISDDYKEYKPGKSKDETKVEKASKVVSNTMSALDKKASAVIQNTIDLTIDITVDNKDGVTQRSHEYMMKNSDVYKKTFEAVSDTWAENTLIGKLKFYLDLDENARRAEFNVLNTQAVHSEERKAQFEQDKMNSLYKKAKGLFSDNETSSLYSLLSELPISSLNTDGTLLAILNGDITIDEAINKLLNESTLSKQQINDSKVKGKDLANFYIDKVAPKGFKTHQHLKGDEKLLTAKLSALYGMQKIEGIDSLLKKSMSTKKHKSYINELLELSAATEVLDNELFNTIAVNYDSHNGSLNHKVFDNNVQVKHVTQRTIGKEFREDLGWKVLRQPTKTEAGIIYRDSGDITYQSGLGTQLQLQPDLTVNISSNYNLKSNNATKKFNGYGSTVVFTNDELNSMGLVRDPIAALVKGYSHRMLLQETQAIRQEIVNEFTYDYEKDGETTLLKNIEEGTHDWYIKLPEGLSIDKLPEKIRSRYKTTGASSDVDNFSDKVTLVRKDMSDFVEGYKEIQIGQVGSTLNKAFSILKKSILLQKIHWVIVNPTKIALDATSNTAYLLSRNIPISTIYSKTKSISNDMVEFTKLREELLKAEFQNRANPSKAKQKKINNLENKIKNHRMATAYFRGFIQSIAIDLGQKNEHTAAGLQKETANILSYIFRNDDKSLNKAGVAIDKISKFGVNGEDLLIKVADLIKQKGTSNVSSAVADTLEDIGNHIKDIKNESDVERYLQEYFATPGSSLVSVGSMLTQVPDVISKVILQEHLVEQAIKEYKDKHNGKNPPKDMLPEINEKAALEAVTAFIDYKVNIPQELRFLEQTGITSFITFWSRIQKVALTSLRNNPVNAATVIILNELLGFEGATIFDATLSEKWGSSGLVGAPTFGVDMIFPTKLI